MSSIAVNELHFERHPIHDNIEIVELRDDAAAEDRRVYSCVALYRRNWRDGWPALGGTRWLQAAGNENPTPEMARTEAASLAQAMFMKNNLIRKAELQLEQRDQFLFGWQGGKGVIWTPWNEGGPIANRKHLTPRRLMCHGRLIERLAGEYIGSEDAGIGAKELRWMERATNFTIGNGCERDTGEGTAQGVHAGMLTTLEMLGKGKGGDRQLTGVPVLICGLGKVGFPLLQMLHDDGAIVSIWERDLTETSDEKLEAFWAKASEANAAIEETHLVTLKLLRGNIFSSEDEALEATVKSERGAHFVCPATDRIEWLTRDRLNGRCRYEILVGRRDATECIVLGPGNTQLPLRTDARDVREAALQSMAAAGVLFIPDPIVSPGGVIAVSHELTARWKAENVKRDSIRIVDKSVRMLFDLADDKRSSAAVYKAFEILALE